ncbi:MAG: hypothetical protein JO257_08205 [Deltaproteobacteria bacterium]|nr:hypothetical protein [Deltaproteobacteria bacterium]
MWKSARVYSAVFGTAGLLVVEIVGGVYAYRHVDNQRWAFMIAGIGIGGFFLLDWLLRPKVGPAVGRVRALLSTWACIPFLGALGASMWMHYQQRDVAMQDIASVADEAERRLCPTTCNWRSLGAEDVERVVDAMVKARYPEDAAKPPSTDSSTALERDHFHELARVVATDVLRVASDGIAIRELTGLRPDLERALHAERLGAVIRRDVIRRARNDTFAGFVLALAVQSLFVMWIPTLLCLKIHSAFRRLGIRCVERDSRRAARDFRGSVDLRDVRILGEDHSFFLPRLFFGALLVLGTNYVFAPYGLRASYIMSLVDAHAPPGHTSYTLWSTSFSSAPVIVVGFVGFLVYALITATQKFLQDDLDDQGVLSLLVRGLVVILLSFALSSSPIDGTISRLFVFIAGVFPVRALEAISKRVNVSIDPEFEAETSKSFEGLPSLDPVKVFALRSAGIQSSYDLAAIQIEDIASLVRIDPRLLGRAVDRAILIEAVGLELAKKLERFAITAATELVALNAEGLPDAVANAFNEGDAAVKDPAVRRAAVRLAGDPRVEKVKAWLDESRGNVTR